MTRICITGGPRTGKTTLAERLVGERGEGRGGVGLPPTLFHTDDLIELGWSGASEYVADRWLNEQSDWIIEGVAVPRALRKWNAAHPGDRPPVDRVIYLDKPHQHLTEGQARMARGVETVFLEIEPWLREHGVEIQRR